MTITVIHGPQASGKTFHAERFRKHFGCRDVVDGWRPGSDLSDHSEPVVLRNGDLLLTNANPDAVMKRFGDRGVRLIPIEQARRMIGVGPVPKRRQRR
ncbi:hypothetical protein HZY97_20335 [Sphingomonas sp. R-74633]|uniref:hypothetical protein n=1 Tax=Sphingomonas sp. R-74633 TaxID=2751188 RepID=UPI0015D0E3A4|nr:hypothetical protein [Sphingomonas sp. R-74633]NYT43135.1 hypothetical protein [Sphingomonas sp. R-74633]